MLRGKPSRGAQQLRRVRAPPRSFNGLPHRVAE